MTSQRTKVEQVTNGRSYTQTHAYIIIIDIVIVIIAHCDRAQAGVRCVPVYESMATFGVRYLHPFKLIADENT